MVPRGGGQDSTLEKAQMAGSHSSSPWFYGQSALCTGIDKRIFIMYKNKCFQLFALVLGYMNNTTAKM